jgi:hypothetical protein
MPSFIPIIDVDEMLSYIDAEKHRVPHYDREHFICDMKHQVYVEGRELTDGQFDAVERIYNWLVDQIEKLDKKNGRTVDPLVSIIPEFVPLDDVVETDDSDLKTNKLVKYRDLCPWFNANQKDVIDQIELVDLYNVGFGEDPKDCARRDKLYNILLAYKAQLGADQKLIANVLKPKKKKVSVPVSASKPKSKSGVFKHTTKSSNKITSFFKKI